MVGVQELLNSAHAGAFVGGMRVGVGRLGREGDRADAVIREELVGEQPNRPRPDAPVQARRLADEDVEPPGAVRDADADLPHVLALARPGIELDEARRTAVDLDDAGGRRVGGPGGRAELGGDGREIRRRLVGIPPLVDVGGAPPGDDQRVVVRLVAEPPDGEVPIGGDDVIHSSGYRVTRGDDTPPLREYDSNMRLLIVENEPEVATSLARGLAEAGNAVDVALSGEEALDTIRAGLPYDVAVLDVMLGGEIDGIALCRYLRAEAAPTAVLMLTARDEVQDRLAGFDAGADDYLAKPFHFEEVLARVRALSRRQAAPQVRVLGAGNLTMDRDARQVMVDGGVLATTRREYELLELFLRHPAQVLSKEQIHDAVWGDGQTAESGLVEVYASKVRRKLIAARATVGIETCRGIGYRLISGTAVAVA